MFKRFLKNWIFTQDRIGKNNIPFTIYKLRTMTNHKVIPTRAWLRKTRIDELPQVWNILKGDMSLVGPRPLVIQDHFSARKEWRMPVKPGMTGLWQIKSGSMKDIMIWDYLYVNNKSWWYDFKLVLRTPYAIWRRRI